MVCRANKAGRQVLCRELLNKGSREEVIYIESKVKLVIKTEGTRALWAARLEGKKT